MSVTVYMTATIKTLLVIALSKQNPVKAVHKKKLFAVPLSTNF